MKKNTTFKFITVMLIFAMLISVVAVSATADETNIPASGYAAVGIVDTEAHKAEVLLGTGEQGTVYFNGNAPATGAVYSYTRDANNLYTFTAERGNHGNSDQLAAGQAWNLFYTPNGWMWNGLGQTIFPNASPMFIRYGNDNWTLSALGNFVETNGSGWIFGYTLDEVQTDADKNYWAVGAIVLGGYNNGSIDTTGFDTCLPSVTATNNLSAFTTSLHANVNTDSIILETGYAAIGAVDAANSYVEILKGTGEQGFVIYEGTAPVTGGVYRYSRNASNVYTFEAPVANHGYSSLTDPSMALWQMWMTADWGGVMWDSALNHYWPTDSTPVFLRTSLTDWTVTDKSCFVTGTQVYGYQLDVSVRDAANAYYNTSAIVLGGMNSDGTFDATGLNALNVSAPAHDLSALTNPLHALPTPPATEPEATEPEATEPEATEPEATEPEATEPEATEPEATEPPATDPEATKPEATEPPATEPEATKPEATEPEATEPEATEPEATEPEATKPADKGYTASGNVIEAGYAAIGAVDAASGKATVLLGNGEHGTVCFAGTAPKSGAVYGYELHDNNVYVFIEKTGNFGNSDQLAAGQAWNLWFEPNGWAWDANNPADIFHVPTPTPIFLRFGDNKWALVTIETVAPPTGANWAFGYALDTVHLPDYDAGNGFHNYQTGALVMGNMNADGSIDTTGYDVLFSNYDVLDLGTIADKPMDVPAATGDAGIGAAVVVMLMAATALVVLKKRN